MDALYADLVHRSLSDAAGRKTSRDFDDRLAQSIMPSSEPPFLDAPYNFCLPRLVFDTGCTCVGLDTNVEEALEYLGLPAMGNQGLRPILTAGDGDCLLHAVCIAIWGFHDRQVRLRTVLVEWVLSSSLAPLLKETFFRGEKKDDAAIGAERSPKQLEEEWETEVVGKATGGREYLSRFHVFILANILRRPIVVLSDPYVRAPDGSVFSPSQMRGIYLPSLASAEDRSKAPIVIVYTVTKGSQGHFTALVAIEGVGKYVPLQDTTSRFPTPYVEDADLHDYFDLTYVRTGGARVQCAKLPEDPPMCPESHKIRQSLLDRAAEELLGRATALQQQAQEAKKQAVLEARRGQEAEQRLLEDNTLQDEPEDMQGVQFEEKTLDRGDTTIGRGRYDTDMATSPPDDGFINPLRAFSDTSIRTGTRPPFSRAEDHAWGPIRRIPVTGPSNNITATPSPPPRPLLNPLLSSRQPGGLTRQNAHNSQQYDDLGLRLDDPYRDMMASGLL